MNQPIEGTRQMVPVAQLTMPGDTNNPLVFDLATDAANLIEHLVGEFDPATGEYAYDLKLTAMERDALDALPEHMGW